MPSDRSVIIVNYFSADLTAAAVASLRTASSEPLEIVIVDNSVDTAEERKLAGIEGVRLVATGANSGYAGGINRGLEATSGRAIVAMNPDVVLAPAAIDRLVAALEGGAALAGPRLVWDGAAEWLLPPADLMTRSMKLDEVLATRSSVWAKARDRRRMRARHRFWSGGQSFRVRAVSGAVMAFGRELVRRVGGFDERFALYFEEIDFQRRVAEAGGEIVHVSGALCRHVYNQSAGATADAGSRYAESELAYHVKWHGTSFPRLLGIAGAQPRVAAEFVDLALDAPIPIGGAPGDRVVEASTDQYFRTAAGHLPRAAAVRIPDEVAGSLRGGDLFVRIVHRPSMRVEGRYRLTKPLK